MSTYRQGVAETFRIIAADYIADTILLPKLAGLLQARPQDKIEIVVDSNPTDNLKRCCDAGVLLGREVTKDMMAVRIGPDLRMAVVGAPSYFSKRPPPQTPLELADHACLALCRSDDGGRQAWQFEKDGRALEMQVDGPFTCTGPSLLLEAALAGVGLACVPEDLSQEHVAQGRLQRVLEDWCPTFPGYHLCFSNQRWTAVHLARIIIALRYPG